MASTGASINTTVVSGVAITSIIDTGAVGPQGPAGPAGANGLDGINGGQTWVVNVVPSPSPNGSTTTFTTGSSYIAGSLRVFLNGLRQRAGVAYDYVEGTGNLTFNSAPTANDQIIVDYRTI